MASHTLKRALVCVAGQHGLHVVRCSWLAKCWKCDGWHKCRRVGGQDAWGWSLSYGQHAKIKTMFMLCLFHFCALRIAQGSFAMIPVWVLRKLSGMKKWREAAEWRERCMAGNSKGNVGCTSNCIIIFWPGLSLVRSQEKVIPAQFRSSEK